MISEWDDKEYDSDCIEELDENVKTALVNNGVPDYTVDECVNDIKTIMQNYYGNIVSDYLSS